MPDLPEDLYVFVYQNEDESTELVGFPLRSPDDWVVCAFRSPRSAYNFLKARTKRPQAFKLLLMSSVELQRLCENREYGEFAVIPEIFSSEEK
jgi:hypothetical protein